MLRLLGWVMVCALLYACAATSVTYDIIARGTAPGQHFASPAFEVIADETRFHQVFQALHADQLPPPEPPAIDFAHGFVLLVAMGQRSTTGYGVEVARLERYGDVLRVNVRFEAPAPHARHAALVTQPFVLLQVPQAPGVRQVKFFDQAARELASLRLAKSR
jgi:hypothetical protein